MNDEVLEPTEESGSSDLAAVVSYIDGLRAENQAQAEENSDLNSYFDALGLTEEDMTASDGVLYQLREIRKDVAAHPLLTTNFADYTVVEGLLLVLVLWLAVINPCVRMLKGGFSWLMW